MDYKNTSLETQISDPFGGFGIRRCKPGSLPIPWCILSVFQEAKAFPENSNYVGKRTLIAFKEHTTLQNSVFLLGSLSYLSANFLKFLFLSSLLPLRLQAIFHFRFSVFQRTHANLTFKM